MYEATFRLSGTGGYARLSGRADARIALWCNDRRDLLRARCPPGETGSVLGGIDEIAGVDDAAVFDDGVVAITNRCVEECDDPTVDDAIAAHGCLLVPPLRYRDGARLCRVLALESDRLTGCYRSLRESFEVTVVAKRSLEGADALGEDRPVPPAAPPALTRRQRQVFATAFERGYYELPRETTMEAVADEIGIDRRTAEEHRRRAERKLLGALADREFVRTGLSESRNSHDD